MRVKLLHTSEELRRLCPVLLQLRPQYDEAGLIKQIGRQREAGYQLVYVENSQGDIMAVAGFVMANKLAWGKHIYVDDLVTAEASRSQGAGGLLLEWLKQYCRAHGCQQLHLDSGVHRFNAHKFYFREGMKIASYHFSIDEINQDADANKG